MGKKPSISTISSTVFSKDLLMDMFSRLPAKSLGKLRCVCKEWRSIISDPFFKSLHRARFSLKPNFLLLEEAEFFRGVTINETGLHKCGTIVEISSIDFDGNRNFDFKLTLGGVFSLSPSKGELICFAASGGYYICNPSTQELVSLPVSSTPTREKQRVYGFGYIKERNEYVLVRFFHRKPDGYVMECEVMRFTDGCCLKNCSWKVIDAKCPCILRGWGVLVENVFYWMVAFKNDDGHRVGGIASFDLDKEEFALVMPPEGRIASPKRREYLVELKGRLCFVDTADTVSTMDIWVLEDLKNSVWFKEYSINLSGFSKKVCINVQDYWEGKLLLDVHDGMRGCYEYDVENKCLKRNDNISLYGGCHWRLYTDGLFSLESS